MTGAVRVAIYGRHSTDKQNPMSSADQAAACMPLVQYLGGEVVATYLDTEVSGYKRNRPGLKRMLEDVRAGVIDIVVCEALDRLARDGEDVSWIGKTLKFHQVKLHTVCENEIDEIKLAVAGLLGALFLTNLQQKTLRGMEAAVLAGRFAGGRAYGYHKVLRNGANGEPIKGLLEIDEEQANVVRRIFEEFASGLSSIAIAKRLNVERLPRPSGGQWNASTIRGDPRKHVGILNNPLYHGELIWKRRKWSKNPDSDDRERRYRLRDESEWVRIDVPDLRIVDDESWSAVRDELAKRTRQVPAGTSPVVHRRRKHLLSGAIKCATCGSNLTITGKDYYRCAGARERGTCHNTLSIRRGALEQAVLSVIQHRLLTPQHIEIFAAEFEKETRRLAENTDRMTAETTARLGEVDRQIETLAKNMLVSEASPILHRMLAELERERAQLAAVRHLPRPTAQVLSHPTLLERFKQKIGDLRGALTDEAVRPQAADLIGELIESVTIYPGERLEAEVSANIVDMIRYAANENDRLWSLSPACSVMVVAGVGFEPTTFRL